MEIIECQELSEPSPLRVVAVEPLAILAAGDLVDPVHVFEVPLHGLAQAGLESCLWFPSEFVTDLARVERIAPVMAGTVLYEGDG